MTKMSKRLIDLDPDTGLTGSDIPAALGSASSIADVLAQSGGGIAPARTRVVSTTGHTLSTENILEDAGAVLATEGKEIIAATITPVSNQSVIRIEADFFVLGSSTSVTAMLVIDGVPGLVRRVCQSAGASCVLMTMEVPSTGEEMTVSLRVGRGASTGTGYVNRAGAAQYFSPENNITSLTLTELL